MKDLTQAMRKQQKALEERLEACVQELRRLCLREAVRGWESHVFNTLFQDSWEGLVCFFVFLFKEATSFRPELVDGWKIWATSQRNGRGFPLKFRDSED